MVALVFALFTIAYLLWPAPPAEPIGQTVTSEPAPEPMVELNQSSFQAPEDPKPEEAEVLADPYAGAREWCEPLFYETRCQKDEDCADLTVDVIGRPLRCGRPWWSKKDDLRDEEGKPITVCLPGYAGPLERTWRKARLREIVAQAYFDEGEHCDPWTWDRVKDHRRFVQRFNGEGVHRQHWRCQREWASAEKLASFLWVPYRRETTGRPWKRHRLNPDEKANLDAYVDQAKVYGWKVELGCATGKRLRRCKPQNRVVERVTPLPDAKRRNPYYAEPKRWQYGLGGRGKNAALGVLDWDVMAPPEVLCLEVADTEAYLRDVRHAVEVFRGRGVNCDGDYYKGRAIRVSEKDGERVETEVDEPSWIDVHRVASGGKFCPQKGARAKKFQANLRAALERNGVRPDEPVTLGMLGRPIPKEGQIERAQEILATVDAKLPPPWDEDEG